MKISNEAHTYLKTIPHLIPHPCLHPARRGFAQAGLRGEGKGEGFDIWALFNI